MTPNILKSSLENASFSIIFQIVCRGVTFLLNAFTVRHVGQDVLGVMNVRLLLLESIILSMLKEPFFKACLTNTAEHNWAQVVNLLWLTVPLCSLFSLFLGYIWLSVLTTDEELPAYYTFAVWAVAASCVIELSSLVVQLVSSAFLFVRLRIVLDSIMIAIRTLTFVCFIIYNPEYALLAFGVAQLVAAIFYTTSHYLYFQYYIKSLRKEKSKLRRRMSVNENEEEYVLSEFPFRDLKDFLPGHLENNESDAFGKLRGLTWSFFLQSILKLILTEGERLIMTMSSLLTFKQQGAYELVNNLGSLAARFIFRPIEDSSYFYFTQMVKRDKSLNEQHPGKVQESVNVLMHLCSTVASIGLIVLVFGQSYSSLLLWLYGGSKLIDESLPVFLLRTHCLAVFLLGINGVTECYTNATADSKTINKNSSYMIGESIIFVVVSCAFVNWFGPVGFIFGNCVNMGLRIILSISFINKRHAETNYRPLRGLVPKPVFSGSLILAALVTNVSQAYFFPDAKLFHFIIGVIMFVLVMLSWAYEHQDLILLAVNKWYDRRNGRRKSE
ncbi:protein RFT1 homolog [Belonocnema kinseyi]|uniref:protein RFT1 homolog n=1 Tax=Belonocnema kinseyi TaxID=2817044 RepID=UPI00143D6076|nr:protein RFT1 homolog [Belonocnema kinseyi]